MRKERRRAVGFTTTVTWASGVAGKNAAAQLDLPPPLPGPPELPGYLRPPWRSTTTTGLPAAVARLGFTTTVTWASGVAGKNAAAQLDLPPPLPGPPELPGYLRPPWRSTTTTGLPAALGPPQLPGLDLPPPLPGPPELPGKNAAAQLDLPPPLPGPPELPGYLRPPSSWIYRPLGRSYRLGYHHRYLGLRSCPDTCGRLGAVPPPPAYRPRLARRSCPAWIPPPLPGPPELPGYLRPPSSWIYHHRYLGLRSCPDTCGRRLVGFTGRLAVLTGLDTTTVTWASGVARIPAAALAQYHHHRLIGRSCPAWIPPPLPGPPELPGYLRPPWRSTTTTGLPAALGPPQLPGLDTTTVTWLDTWASGVAGKNAAAQLDLPPPLPGPPELPVRTPPRSWIYHHRYLGLRSCPDTCGRLGAVPPPPAYRPQLPGLDLPPPLPGPPELPGYLRPPWRSTTTTGLSAAVARLGFTTTVTWASGVARIPAAALAQYHYHRLIGRSCPAWIYHHRYLGLRSCR